MQLNEQATEAPDRDSRGALSLHSAWYTIQGEGPLVGCPALFVRLAGCNLKCKLCDTDYTSNRKRVGAKQLVAYLHTLGGWKQSKLIVITGGEPFRQNIDPFVMDLMLQHNKIVQVETNGTYFLPEADCYNEPDRFHIVCSPKTPKIHPQVTEHVSAFKYLVEAEKTCPVDGLPLSVLGEDIKPARPPHDYKGPVYVQAVDNQDEAINRRNMEEAVRSSLAFGYRLSVQTHKIVGLA